MKYLKRCPLVIMLAISLLVVWVATGVPKVLAFAEEQMNRNEYRVETLPEYSPTTGEAITGNDVTGGDITGNNVSGNTVSGNTGVDLSISGGDLSGNTVSGQEF